VQFLQRLLLVHGRWNYNRMCVLVCYMFYKNIASVLTQYWYQIYVGFSGQKFILEAASQVYNIVRVLGLHAPGTTSGMGFDESFVAQIFTGLPVLLLGVFDQDVSAKTALSFPFLYQDGLHGKHLNRRVFSCVA
jgi:phospholipid-transporting ATPase